MDVNGKLYQTAPKCPVPIDKNPIVVSDRFIVHQIAKLFLHEYMLKMNHLSVYLNQEVASRVVTRGQKDVILIFNRFIMVFFDCEKLR